MSVTRSYSIRESSVCRCFFLLIILTLITSSCRQEHQKLDLQSVKDRPLTLWHALRGDDQVRLEKQLRAYQAQSGIQVRALQLPHNAFSNKLQVSIPKGNGPDLFIHAHDRIGDWAEAGLIEPISYWVHAEHLSQLLPSAVDALTYRRQLYGLPLSCKALALFYRKDLVAYPPKTTDELITLARNAMAKSGQQHHQKVWGLAYPELDSLYFHAPWLHAFGGTVLNEDHAQLNSPAMKKSALAIKALRDESLIPPEVDGALASELFRTGRLAFLINGPWFVAELGQLSGAHAQVEGPLWGVAPLPVQSTTNQPLAPYLSVEGVMLSARARQPKKAWHLARYLASSEQALKRLSAGELVAHRDPYQSLTRLPSWLSAFRGQLEHSVPLSNEPLMKSIWKPVKRALGQIILRKADPDVTLEEAQRAIDKVISRGSLP